MMFRAGNLLLFLVTTALLKTGVVNATFLPAFINNNHKPNSEKTSSTNQEWDVDTYRDQYSFVWKYGSSLIEDCLDPQPGEDILDVGCGSGDLTQQIYDHQQKKVVPNETNSVTTTGRVFGLDADPEMIRTAKSVHPDSCCSFFQANIASKTPIVLPATTDDTTNGAPAQVDAIFSNAALHWISGDDGPKRAVTNMSNLLKPGGRFVVEFGGKGNVGKMVSTALEVMKEHKKYTSSSSAPQNPWYFPSIAEYANLLEGAGIEVLEARLFDRPTSFAKGEEGMANWFRMMGGTLFESIPDKREQEEVISKIVDRLKAETAFWNGTEWKGDYRRIRIVGRKVNEK